MFEVCTGMPNHSWNHQSDQHASPQAVQVALLVCSGLVVFLRERMHAARRYIRLKEQAGLP